MRIVCTATSLATLLAVPAMAQERELTTAELISQCVETVQEENGLSIDDLSRLQLNHPYLAYGEPYTLGAGGTATDICRIAIYAPLAREHDRLVEELAHARAQAGAAETEQSRLRAELRKYEEPLGLSLPDNILSAILWLRDRWHYGWFLGLVFGGYAFGHIYTQTPWGKRAAERASARRWRRKRESFGRI